MDGRIQKIIRKNKDEREHSRQESQKSLAIQTNEQIEAVVTELEENPLPRKIRTIDLNSNAKEFLENFFEFTPAFEPDDDRYHSLWLVDLKAE
jgi:hypothetical protein